MAEATPFGYCGYAACIHAHTITAGPETCMAILR